ncbi:MAG: phosphatidylserine decarboxylase [Acidobacteriota bacterium]|nr:phosphatidylserine decarboxylase [Acidobacteriota bacterium]
MVKEGYSFGLPLLLIAGALFWLRIYVPAVIFLLLAVFVLNFFRDPERTVPTDASALVSPADGRVVKLCEEEFEGRTMQRLSIFMSPLDVHVNRAPIAGVIVKVAYKPGSFKMASRAEASVENEQNLFSIEGEQGVVYVKQIAGALARRIVFWKKPGQRLERGERIGLIRFGSRVDVIAELGVEWRVKAGDYVRAGSTILGVTGKKG